MRLSPQGSPATDVVGVFGVDGTVEEGAVPDHSDRQQWQEVGVELNMSAMTHKVPGPLGGAAMARPFPSAEKLGSMCVIAFWGTLRRPSWLAARPSPQQLVRVASDSRVGVENR